ncbi:drebrin-like protein B isoform X2 [Brachyistius frenatus]|uniref:drebrin-like protein B isoform X2 n=1 Tax=Brachyistius frenatus TaxID=100188 RepID=UPI0037E81674
MAVNLSKNGTALMAAYKEVVDGKSDTNWALFTYEGNSSDVRLAETGDGGLHEMVEELNSGKVMYAFCRVQDPNSGLPKYVLINWTGEGVKEFRKGIYANHVSSMAGFLKGAHVTINARSEDDVEPDAILAKVGIASGGSYNLHQQTQEFRDAPRGPVGSVYRKTNAVEEIQQTRKDDFWVQAQRDEEGRQRDEGKRAQEERQKVERDRMEMEERQTKERERRAKERAQQIEQEKIHQKRREEDEEEREREQQRLWSPPVTLSEQIQDQQENRNKVTGINSAASVQKANEAKSLISQRSFNPRDIFKQKEQSFEAGDRPSPSKPGKLRSPFFSQKAFDKVEPEDPPSTAPAEAPPSVLTPVTPMIPLTPLTPLTHLTPLAPLSPVTPVSPAQPAAVYTEDEEWSDEFDDDADEAIPEETPVEENLYEVSQPGGTDEDLYENVLFPNAAAAEDHSAEASGQDVRARAIYDYQALDDTEITFDPDDIITQIEMLDEGWWRGYGPDGHYGMFPANYVELL